MSKSYNTIIKDGLWNNNVVFSQMLALCPLLAVTGTATNGLGMGLASLVVLILASTTISMAKGIITQEVRIPVFVLLIAGIVTLVDMYINAYLHELYKVLGLFIPLIVTNCAILGRAESFAFKNEVLPSVVDAVMMGIGFTIALVVLGAAREITGSGTLFANASLLLGDSFSFLELTLIEDYKGVLLMILPPGAFIALGFILAGKRIIDRKLSAAKDNQLPVIQPVAEH
ncbi:MAG: electron transport complex subunit E [Gammaproteobacteria bacterium]|nr:electron transport complex subunit E [Gammaproteobacteria bacterium]